MFQSETIVNWAFVLSFGAFLIFLFSLYLILSQFRYRQVKDKEKRRGRRRRKGKRRNWRKRKKRRRSRNFIGKPTDIFYLIMLSRKTFLASCMKVNVQILDLLRRGQKTREYLNM